MCTSIAWKNSDFYFGRNLDLETYFDRQVVITPRGYPFDFRRAGSLHQHYALIGMASVVADTPLYFEAVNEKGLGMAGLNFAGNAFYAAEEVEGKHNVSPYELIWWVLGQCATVEQARSLLEKTQLIHLPFNDAIPVAELHWHIADRHCSIVLECCRDGMHIYDNPVGVLTNNPPFAYHLQNLTQYINLTPHWPENRFAEQISILPVGSGQGSIGLPGDVSPISRFVRATYYRLHAVSKPDENSSVAQFFHMLDGVAMIAGTVAAPNGWWDYTQYSCCVNADQGIYYYKTYENNQITAISLRHADLEGAALTSFPLVTEQQVRWENKA